MIGQDNYRGHTFPRHTLSQGEQSVEICAGYLVQSQSLPNREDSFLLLRYAESDMEGMAQDAQILLVGNMFRHFAILSKTQF